MIARHPEKRLALVAEGEQLTYGQLRKRVEGAAARFEQDGVERGRPLLLMADLSVDFVVDYLAAHRVDAIALPVDPRIDRSRLEWVRDRIERWTPPQGDHGIVTLLLLPGQMGTMGLTEGELLEEGGEETFPALFELGGVRRLHRVLSEGGTLVLSGEVSGVELLEKLRSLRPIPQG